jgi:putative DNA primase/helicase
MTTTAKTMQEAALELVAQGFKVFPLVPRHKKPLTDNGFKDATQIQARVKEFWPKGTQNNIGIVCEGLLVCDFDHGDTGKMSLAKMESEHCKLPRTWTIRTGGGTEEEPREQGLQYVYRVDKELNIRSGAGKYGYECFDIRANGGYIVAVPSVTRLQYETIDDSPVVDAPAWLIELAKTKKNAVTGKPEPQPISDINNHHRHVNLISLIGKLRHDNFSEEMIEKLAQAANADADIPLPREEVTEMREQYAQQAMGTAHYNLTDMGNAERLIDKYGAMIRYNYERKLWLIWNGKCWKWDTGGEIMQLAQRTARSIYGEITPEDDEETEKAKAHWAASSESNQRLCAMVTVAESMVSITIDKLDRDIWLLNCANGTINLKTGVLQTHNPSDYITRVISTNYNPDATSEEWVKFLKRTFGNKDDLIAFAQRALGYSITGSQGEMAIFFCHGEGWNGKSTLLGACRLILEEYAAEIEPAAFMVDKNRGTGPNEAIASLYNVNFVTSTEIEEGQRLSTALLKRMTGGESLRCEHKFERGFTYKPRYKLWMSGNHEPEISDTTKSIKNRFKKVPFLFTITAAERVQHYDEVLAGKYGEAILAWLVKGCLEWQRTGLGESSEVQEATQSYFENQDVLHDFLAECKEQASETCFKSELYLVYEKWCNENGDKYVLGKKTFNTRIAEKGFISDRGAHNKPIWKGLRPLTETEKGSVTKDNEKVTNVTNVTEKTVTSLHEKNQLKLPENQVTKVTKVTSPDVKAPEKLENMEPCPVCGSENIGFWDDGAAGYYYCLDCFEKLNNEEVN